MITVAAHAKVNLTLEVLGRRDDGYHEVASIMQTFDLCDTIDLEHADAITLECDRPELQSPNNLALKAAKLLGQKAGHSRGCRITLHKKVPISAGLGGGSSDAAATLMGLNRLWELGLSVEDIVPLAAQLGSDVPFFLHGGTAMALGRGEQVRPLPPADLSPMVLLVPPIDIPEKTATVYGKLSSASFTKGHLTRKLAARIRGGGDVPPQFHFNAFDEVASEAFPGLEAYWEALHSLGAREIHLAGSGPALFAPVSRREVGTALQLVLRHRHGWESYLVNAWQPAENTGT